MATKTEANAIPPELLAEMERAIQIALSNVRDPEVMRQAAERMDQMREDLRRQDGEMSIAVDLIREVRDEE
jgi:hypothetical protein